MAFQKTHSQYLNELRELLGDILMNSEFVDSFYLCFFTLCPTSELKFTDVEKQKKAFTGFLSSVVRLNEDEEAREKLKWVKKKHERMHVKPEEIRAFCTSLIVTLKTKTKIGKSDSLEKIEKSVKQLGDFMCSSSDKGDCNIM